MIATLLLFQNHFSLQKSFSSFDTYSTQETKIIELQRNLLILQCRCAESNRRPSDYQTACRLARIRMIN